MVQAVQFGKLGQSFLDSTFADFKHTIEIQSLYEQADGQGGHAKVWVSFASVEAFVLNQSGDEPLESGRKITHNIAVFHIRPIDGLTEKMKIVFNSEDYLITRINDIANINQWLIIEAEKGVRE